MKKAMLVLIVLLIATVPAFANDGTFTITADDINTVLYAVVENVDQVNALNVDLYDNSAALSATVTTADGETVSMSLVLTPVPQDDGEGYYWVIASATINGTPLPPRAINDINAALSETEFRQARTSAENNLLTDVTIDDGSITYEVNEDVTEAIENFEPPQVEPLTPERRPRR